MKSMCDLSRVLQRRILSSVPITLLEAVRSTSKLWESISKEMIVGEKAARRHFLGFLTIRKELYSLRFDDQEGEPSIKKIKLFDPLQMSQVLQLDGVVLCITEDHKRLFLWNPYLGQTRCIEPKTKFSGHYNYALGSDSNGIYKILRFVESEYDISEYDIFDFSSNSWRVVVDSTWGEEWSVPEYYRGVTLKGNIYFVPFDREEEAFLICFDFTRERFSQGLDLPFYPGEQHTS